MIDAILANPAISQGDLARYFGYSESWVSTILASDAFKAALHARAKEVVDPILLQTIETQFEALALRSLEILREKLNRPASAIPDQLALRTLELSSRARGYGLDRPAAVPPQEMHVHLELLGENLDKLIQRKRAPIEGDFRAIDHDDSPPAAQPNGAADQPGLLPGPAPGSDH